MPNSNPTAFCVEELKDAKISLAAIAESLPKLRAKYEKYKGTGLKREQDAKLDLYNAAKDLLYRFPVIISRLLEYGEASLITKAKKLYAALKSYDFLGRKNYTPLCDAVKAFSDLLPDSEKNINTAALGRLMNRVQMGYYPTDLKHVDMLKNAVVFPDGDINLIDPCCGEGLALERFAKDTRAKTYGIELDELRGEIAQKRLHRVGFGSFFNSTVSHGAFQVLFLNPPYLSVKTETGSRRLEQSFLADSIRLLCDGGLLIYIIPYYRATEQVCRVLCENFENLRVHKFMGSEFSNFRQVAFTGTKMKRRENSKRAQKLAEYMLDIENIPPLSDLPCAVYTLPPAQKPVEQFKGAVFNIRELAEQLKHSKSTKRLFEHSELDTRERRPLMPLNLSQIGLVGASGMMNGLIDCECPHVIKGRIIKQKKTRLSPDKGDGRNELHEVTSNKLIFNVLTPSGYKSLG